MLVAPSPPECSSGGTGVPPPHPAVVLGVPWTKGCEPAVPIGFDDAPIELCATIGCAIGRKKCYNKWFLCWVNVNYVVFLLLTVLVMIPWSPPPTPPWTDPTNATTCPFDVVACNRQCALMHVNCTENNRNTNRRRLGKGGKSKPSKPNCDSLHGAETASSSTAAFDSVQEKTAYLESLDWEHEPTLWGLRKEHIGDTRCDRSGCGQTLCECNFDGGDCPQIIQSNPYLFLPPGWFFWSVIYLCSMYSALVKVIRYHLNAPKLRDEGELTAYVEKMQRAQPQVSSHGPLSH